MQSIGKDLWVVRKDHFAPGFGNIGVTATIIRFAPKQVMIISPVLFTLEDLRQINELGDVQWLVSPNPLHHLYLAAAAAAFPNAKLAGPAETAKKHENELKFSIIMEDYVRVPWAESVSTYRVPARAPVFEEFVFFHRASRTFVVTDLMFNVHNPGTAMNHFFLKLNGADRKLTVTRLGRLAFNNKLELRKVVEQVLELNPENVVVAHGEPVVGGAGDKLRSAFKFVLK